LKIKEDIPLTSISNPYNVGLLKLQNETITNCRSITKGIINAFSKEQYSQVFIDGSTFNRNSEVQLLFEGASFYMISSNFTTLDIHEDKTLTLTVQNQTTGSIDEPNQIPAGTLFDLKDLTFDTEFAYNKDVFNHIIKTKNSLNKWVGRVID
jgi:hypothetical protein